MLHKKKKKMYARACVHMATMVAEHVQQVFRDRRTFLKENSDYKSRARDPGEG